MEARGRVLQELDRHPEALLALSDAVKQVAVAGGEEPPSTLARLHYAIAQVRACRLVGWLVGWFCVYLPRIIFLNIALLEIMFTCPTACSVHRAVQSAIATHAPDLMKSSLREARLNGQVRGMA
jgi:hypothetical protein